jgi:dolichyl-phosphate beta-glucosyltransferase
MQKICIVIPCYNEGKRLEAKDFTDFLSENENVNFCFVNNGSRDNTLDILNKLYETNSERIKIINFPKNAGKAESVRIGMLEADKWLNFDILGYFDADLSTPLTEIKTLLNHLNMKPEYKIAFGSRFKRIGSVIERDPKRHYLGRVIATFVSIMLNIGIYDSQCGAKLFKKEIIQDLFAKPFISRWLFDVEIFFRVINKYGLEESKKNMIEVPLNEWKDKKGSKITFGYICKVPFELLKINYKYKHIAKS